MISVARRRIVTLAALVALTTLGCYGTAHNQRADAEDAWRRGAYAEALTHAHAMYARFATANAEAATKVPDALSVIRERLGEELVIPKDLLPRPSPDVAKHGDRAKHPERTPQNELMSAVLTLDAGVVLPAVSSIQNLRMSRLARPLLVVLDRPEPFTDSSQLTRGLDTATRSLVVKRAALEALEILAAPSPPAPASGD